MRGRILRASYKVLRALIELAGINRFELIRDMGHSYRNYLHSHADISHVTVLGHKMYLDPLDSLNLSVNKIYEPYETQLVLRIVKLNSIVVDIGANIGYYTLIFAKLVGREGKVIAFEPESHNFQLLRKNVTINGYSDIVRLEQKAVSNRDEKQKLYLNQKNLGGHRINEPTDCSHDSLQVIETISLDKYLANNSNHIDFVKMDIEGAEYLALEGMHSILRQSHSIRLMVAFHPPFIREYGYAPEQVIEFLRNNGFRIYFVDPRSQCLRILDSSTLNDLMRVAHKLEVNLLCEKEGKDERMSTIIGTKC
jgi:FkbM family methyltransferase